MMDHATLGIMASLFSPLLMVFGFMLWDKNWKAGAYQLNCFKGSLASSFFLITALVHGINHSVFKTHNILILFLSSFLGIVIGDSTWLMALQIIGARRVIIVDTMKPGLGAIFGAIFLGEPLTVMDGIGLVLTSIGVLIVCLEEQQIDDETSSTNTDNEARKDHGNSDGSGSGSGNVDGNENDNSNTKESLTFMGALWGYTLAAINVILDAYGAILTKGWGSAFTPFEIALLRFGFASVVLFSTAAVYGLIVDGSLPWNQKQITESASTSKDVSSNAVVFVELSQLDDDTLENNDSIRMEKDDEDLDSKMEGGNANVNADNGFPGIEYDDDLEDPMDDGLPVHVSYGPALQSKWYQFPYAHEMSTYNWISVCFAVLCVTYTCTALNNFALFQISVGLQMTLTSISPIYALPVGYLIKRELVTMRAVCGSVISVFGIAFLCIFDK